MPLYIAISSADLATRVTAVMLAEDRPGEIAALSESSVNWFRERAEQLFGAIGLYVAALPPGE